MSRYKLNVFEAGGSRLSPEEIARINQALYWEKQNLLDGLGQSEADQFPADAAQLTRGQADRLRSLPTNPDFATSDGALDEAQPASGGKAA